jgi:hypothetical protein
VRWILTSVLELRPPFWRFNLNVPGISVKKKTDEGAVATVASVASVATVAAVADDGDVIINTGRAVGASAVRGATPSRISAATAVPEEAQAEAGVIVFSDTVAIAITITATVELYSQKPFRDYHLAPKSSEETTILGESPAP